MSKLRESAETAVNDCLALQEDESCLIVTDDKCEVIGEEIYKAAKKSSSRVSLIKYKPSDASSGEPPVTVAEAMQNADVVFAPTYNSLSHTKARSSATKSGTRVATLPAITEEVFISGLSADYSQIEEQCKRIYNQVSGANKIRVCSENGTDIHFELGERDWFQDTGIIHNSGVITNLPAGEVFISPVSGDGTFVVDGTMKPHGLLDNDQELTFEVKDGYVTNIDDDIIRNRVEQAAESVGDAAYNVAELGVGTNIGVSELYGSVLLDEKAAGTIHIAIGDDHAIGGDIEAPIHLDGVILDPTVYVDGDKIDLPINE